MESSVLSSWFYSPSLHILFFLMTYSLSYLQKNIFLTKYLRLYTSTKWVNFFIYIHAWPIVHCIHTWGLKTGSGSENPSLLTGKDDERMANAKNPANVKKKQQYRCQHLHSNSSHKKCSKRRCPQRFPSNPSHLSTYNCGAWKL